MPHPHASAIQSLTIQLEKAGRDLGTAYRDRDRAVEALESANQIVVHRENEEAALAASIETLKRDRPSE